MNNKTNPPQAAADEPDRPHQGMGLGAAMADFPRLFRGEPPRDGLQLFVQTINPSH